MNTVFEDACVLDSLFKEIHFENFFRYLDDIK